MSDSGTESDDSLSTTTDTGSSSSTSETDESDYSIGKPDPEDECCDGSAAGLELDETCECLFCKEQLELTQLDSHLRTAHHFDLTSLRQKFSMDQLAFIRLVNFVRIEVRKRRKLNADDKVAEEIDKFVQILSNCTEPMWDSESYLQPVLEDDPLLTYWFDDLDAVVLENTHVSGQNSEADGILSSLRSENEELKTKISHYERALDEAVQKIELMKDVMNRIMGDDSSASKHKILKRYTESLSKTNQEYFESYDDSHIHAVMLNDRQRTEAYRDAILKNAADFKGKVVLDVGCGTAILSMFAAKAGASKVFAVDRSKIIDKAVEIVKENGFADCIECIQGTVESIFLPVDRVDIIISEFMGYFLLFEGMLASYIDARNKFLKPGGAMYPNTAEIFIVGIDDFARSEQQVCGGSMWDDVYGFKMSVMKQQKIKLNSLVETVDKDKCVTTTDKILSLDLLTCNYSDAAFESKFELTVMRDSHVTGITGYFDTGFTQGTQFKNVLSTSPSLPETHWYQTTFPLGKPLNVKAGDVLHGVFECRPNLKNSRSLDVFMSIGEDKYSYLLD